MYSGFFQGYFIGNYFQLSNSIFLNVSHLNVNFSKLGFNVISKIFSLSDLLFLFHTICYGVWEKCQTRRFGSYQAYEKCLCASTNDHPGLYNCGSQMMYTTQHQNNILSTTTKTVQLLYHTTFLRNMYLRNFVKIIFTSKLSNLRKIKIISFLLSFL